MAERLASPPHLSLPRPLDLSKYVPSMPKLGRPLRVALPCVGIDGCGEAFHQGKVWWEGCNVWDLDAEYRTHLEMHFLEATGKIPDLHLGKEKGNMLNCSAEDLEDKEVDLLCAGFPCPPWAGNGNKAGVKDKRFQVFFKGIEWILYLIQCRGLIGICLENVKGTMNNIDGREPYYPRLMTILQCLLPMFRFRIDHLDAKNYLSPAARPRVLLRGMHVKFAPQGVPPPLPPMGTAARQSACQGE